MQRLTDESDFTAVDVTVFWRFTVQKMVVKDLDRIQSR